MINSINPSADSFLADIDRLQARSQSAQQQLSSGRRVSKPSDDPVAAADIVRLSGEQAVSDQFSKNINEAKSRLTALRAKARSSP